MGTRVPGLGLESDFSPDFAELGLGLEFWTLGLKLDLDSRLTGLDLTRTRQTVDSSHCIHLTNNLLLCKYTFVKLL